MIGVVASEHRLDLAACVGSRVAESAVDAAQSAQAGNSLEKMLCHQTSAGLSDCSRLDCAGFARSAPDAIQ